jgi:hypothetical protein
MGASGREREIDALKSQRSGCSETMLTELPIASRIADPNSEPWVPSVQDFPKLGSMGVFRFRLAQLVTGAFVYLFASGT